MKRLLLIDDDPTFWFILVRVLEDIEVHWSSNVTHGLKYCNTNSKFFDLVLLDINGTTLADNALECISEFNKPVLLISGQTSPLKKDIAFQEKAPLDELVKRVRALI